MFCSICAYPVDGKQRRCKHCGAEWSPAIAAPHHDGLNPTRRWTVAGLPFLAVLLVALSFIGREVQHRRHVANFYDHGVSALASGDLFTARADFTAAGSYADAKRQARTVDDRLAPYLDQRDRARVDIDSGDYQAAIDLLLPISNALPNDDTTFLLLSEARSGLVSSLEKTAADAEHTENWLVAEQALTALQSERPDDADLAAHLAAIRRDHAPLVYASHGTLYVSNPDLSGQRAVVDGMSVAWPMWSPDLTQIAFVTSPASRRELAGNLYVVNTDGSGLRLLTSDYLPFSWPSWSPDGTKIAFSNPSHFDTYDGTGSINLTVVDLASGRETDITHDQFDFATSPSWSPDGAHLAFVDRVMTPQGNTFDFENGDVHIADLTTGTVTDLTGDAVQNERQVSWSPTGDRLLIFTDPGDWSSDDVGQIMIWDLATSRITDIPVGIRIPEVAIWSPDGTRIAWVEGNDVVKLWSSAGEVWVRLTTDIGAALSWAPDGHALLAPGATISDPSYIIQVDRQFGARTPIKLSFDVNGGSLGPPVWAPRTAPTAKPGSGGTALDPAA